MDLEKKAYKKQNSRLRIVERVLRLLNRKIGTSNDVFKKKIKIWIVTTWIYLLKIFWI